MDELTKALNDYYDPRTDHLQKQYLHDQLNRFLTDRNSWCIALSAFQQQQQDRSFVMSPVVVYFLLQVVEHSILHQYADQQQLRQIILWYLVQFFESIPGYLRTKCCYILVKITRCDHQSSIDEFFQTCYHLIETQTIVGFLLMTTTIEEIGQFNEDCSIKRCQQLKIALQQHTVQIVQVLQHFLRKDDRQNPNSQTIKQQVFTCLDRLINRLSILPLPLDLIDGLFHFVSGNCSIEALNCIHELLLKQHLHRNFDPILHSTLRHSVRLLSLIVEHSSNIPNQDKIIEILRLIFNLHWKRCETIEQFPLTELLTGFYKLTNRQSSQDSFYACLEIWSILIENLKAREEIRISHKENSFEKYDEILRSLSEELIVRVHHGQRSIQSLQETNDFGEFESAIDRYLNECLEVLTKLADFPSICPTIFHRLIGFVQPDVDQLKNVEKFIEPDPSNPARRRFSISVENFSFCREILQKFENLLFAFSRLSNFFYSDTNPNFAQWNSTETRLALLQQFVQIAVFLLRFDENSIDFGSKQIQQDFFNLQNRIFTTLSNLTFWLGQVFAQHTLSNEHQALIRELITIIIDLCASKFEFKEARKNLSMSAGLLLYRLIAALRQNFPIGQCASIQNLTQNLLQISVLSDASDFKLYKLMVKTISAYILPESLALDQFLGIIFQPFQQILMNKSKYSASQNEFQSIRRPLMNYLDLLTDLIGSVRTENNKTRQNLFSPIQPLIVELNSFLPLIVNRDPDCETALISVLLTSFEILRTQMGNDLIQMILQTTFSTFNIENVRNVLRESKPMAHSAVSSFLEFLFNLVNEPVNNKLTQQYLPVIIDLLTNALFPAIRENFNLDVRENFYKLIKVVFLNVWRYFLKGNVLTTLKGDVEATANEQSFLQLMETIAWSFSQSDIEQFRFNLTLCNELQTKCGLYNKTIFRQQISPTLVSLLLTVLLARSHELCRDDIISTLFYIINNENGTYFRTFIQNYLEQTNIQVMINEKHRRLLIETYGRHETDLPSFAQNLNDFIHDYRHYTKIQTT